VAAKRRYVWPRNRLLALDNARALVQSHTTGDVSLCSPLGDHPGQYRNTVFLWLPDAHVGVVWLADQAHHVNGELASRIAKHLDYALWRKSNPKRECLDCHHAFLPSMGWDEAGYPHDVCPNCVARRISLLGPEQVMGKLYDPRAIVQRPPEPQPAA
jgi:hypothetical protein